MQIVLVTFDGTKSMIGSKSSNAPMIEIYQKSKLFLIGCTGKREQWLRLLIKLQSLPKGIFNQFWWRLMSRKAKCPINNTRVLWHHIHKHHHHLCRHVDHHHWWLSFNSVLQSCKTRVYTIISTILTVIKII